MSDSDVYLPSASSTESFDTSYSTSKEEMEVARTIQPHELKNRVENTKLPCYTLPATQQHSIFWNSHPFPWLNKFGFEKSWDFPPLLLYLFTYFYNSFTELFFIFCLLAMVCYVFFLAFEWEIGTRTAHARLMTAVLALSVSVNSVSSEKKVFGFSRHLPTAFIALKRKFPSSQSNKFRTCVRQYFKFEVAGVMSITADMRMLWGNIIKSLAAPEDNIKRIHRWH